MFTRATAFALLLPLLPALAAPPVPPLDEYTVHIVGDPGISVNGGGPSVDIKGDVWGRYDTGFTVHIPSLQKTAECTVHGSTSKTDLTFNLHDSEYYLDPCGSQKGAIITCDNPPSKCPE